MKEYNFLYLTEALNAGDLGRVFGSIRRSAEGIFGKKTKIFDALRDMIIRNGVKNKWSKEFLGPQSPLMRDLQVFTQCMRSLRDAGYAKQAQAAEQEILNLIKNTSATATETTSSLGVKIKALTEKIIRDASNGSITKRGLAQSDKAYKRIVDTYTNNGRYFQTLPQRVKNMATSTTDVMHMPKDGLSIQALKDTLKKQQDQYQELLMKDPLKARVIASNMELTKSKLAKAQAIKSLNSKAEFAPQSISKTMNREYNTVLDPAVEGYRDARIGAQGAIDFKGGEESKKNGILNWLRNLMSRKK